MMHFRFPADNKVDLCNDVLSTWIPEDLLDGSSAGSRSSEIFEDLLVAVCCVSLNPLFRMKVIHR